MHDEKNREAGDAGLGHIIYNVDEETPDAEVRQGEQRDVEIADKESFPASDPPGYSGGSAGDPD